MDDSTTYIEQYIQESVATKKKVLETLIPQINEAAQFIIDCFERGSKVLICGNGGSAADSQHFAAELIIRYEKERRALPAIALSTDTSTLTAGGNDIGFENVFARQVDALGAPEDILVAITTSGNSQNIINAVHVAQQKKMKVVLFNGKDGGKLQAEVVDVNLLIPAQKTSHIQEFHEMVYHIICGIIEKHILVKKNSTM